MVWHEDGDIEQAVYDGLDTEDDSLYWLLHPRVAEIGWYVFLASVALLVGSIVVRWVVTR
jgi:hypothetical protein